MHAKHSFLFVVYNNVLCWDIILYNYFLEKNGESIINWNILSWLFPWYHFHLSSQTVLCLLAVKVLEVWQQILKPHLIYLLNICIFCYYYFLFPVTIVDWTKFNFSQIWKQFQLPDWTSSKILVLKYAFVYSQLKICLIFLFLKKNPYNSKRTLYCIWSCFFLVHHVLQWLCLCS